MTTPVSASVTPPGPPQGKSPAEPSTTLAARWLSPRRKRFWAIVLVLLYTLGGFFGVPALVERLTVNAIRDGAGREATIERVRFNPYVLSLTVEGFAVADPDGTQVAGFQRLYANFQLSSLFRRAWTFREISVDGLYHLLERFAPGDSRLSRMLVDLEGRAGEPSEAERPAGLPRLWVHELQLSEGRLRFRDHVPAQAVDLLFEPITVSIQDLNTLPGRFGQQAVEVLLPNGSVINWQGSLGIGPLQSEGTFSLAGSHLEQTTIYLQAMLPLQSLEGALSARSRYRILEQADGRLDVELDDLEAQLEDVAAVGLTPAAEFLALRTLALSGGSLRYPENTLQFASVRLGGPRVETWLDDAGRPNLLQLVPQDGADADQPGVAPADSAGDSVPARTAGGDRAWRLGIDAFELTDGWLGFEDRGIDPPASLALQGIGLTMTSLSTDDGAEFPLSLAATLEAGGDLAFDGKVALLPAVTASGTVTVGAIPLALAQPYLQQQLNVRIESGTLDSTVELTLRADESVAAEGKLAVAGLRVDDTIEQQALVGWEGLAIDRFEADTAAATFSASQLQFRKPFGRVVINADRSSNLSALSKAPPVPGENRKPVAPETVPSEPGSSASTATQDAAPDTPPAYAIVLGNIAVQDGSLDFADLSLPLPFATRIGALGGTISTIDTRSAEPAALRLEGQVDDYGLARISGSLNLLDPVRATDIKMEFRNLLMSNLSPYSVQFAGREIAEGKLDLDLVYRIESGRMQGENAVVMSDLVLGDKVEHPGAASLPLGLAVALLKDANGVIDIELPVEGDVNDPEFRIGGVIWKAFVGLVTKIVSAPFRLLGNLVGAETEDLGKFRFLAGRADLTPPEMEKIALLQKALLERPELAIEISGGFVPEVDVPALQYQHLRAAVLERAGVTATLAGEEIRLLDERLRAALETLYSERFPETPPETLKAAHTVPPADDPQADPVLDQLAYAADLRDRLLAGQSIGQAELEELGSARAAAIREAFLASGEFAADRVTATAPAAAEAEGEEWIVMELGLAVE